MILSIEKIKIEEIDRFENQINFKIFFDETSIYFDGHFDEFALLPAVAQIHLCTKICESINHQINSAKLTNLKFKLPIRPNTILNLNLQQFENQVKFKFHNEDNMYSQGTIG